MENKLLNDELLRSALSRLIAREHSQNDIEIIAQNLESGKYKLVTGERAVQVGGNANDAVIITGNNNIFFTIHQEVFQHFQDALRSYTDVTRYAIQKEGKLTRAKLAKFRHKQRSRNLLYKLQSRVGKNKSNPVQHRYEVRWPIILYESTCTVKYQARRAKVPNKLPNIFDPDDWEMTTQTSPLIHISRAVYSPVAASFYKNEIQGVSFDISKMIKAINDPLYKTQLDWGQDKFWETIDRLFKYILRLIRNNWKRPFLEIIKKPGGLPVIQWPVLSNAQRALNLSLHDAEDSSITYEFINTDIGKNILLEVWPKSSRKTQKHDTLRERKVRRKNDRKTATTRTI